MTYVKLILLVVLAIPLAALIMMNPHPVTVHLDPLNLGIVKPAEIQAPLAALVIGAALLGLLIGVVLEWIREAGERREKARSDRRIVELEKKLADLEANPPAPAPTPSHQVATTPGGALRSLNP